MATYYVSSVTGNDSTNNGLSSDYPFATLAKLKTVMASGDTAYISGLFREYTQFLNLTGCNFLQWPGMNRWHVTGASAPSSVVETDAVNHVFSCTVPSSLLIDYVCWRYTDDSIKDSYGRRKSFIGLQVETVGEVSTNAASNVPSWHYTGTTLTVGLGSTYGTSNTNIEYIAASDSQGFDLSGCTNCLVQGIWTSRTGMRSASGGYGVSFTTCTGCLLDNFLIENSGYHAYGSIGTINVNNSFSNGMVHGTGPSSTQQITYCAAVPGNPVQSPRATNIVFHTYIPIGIDGTQQTVVPKILSCVTETVPVLKTTFTTIGRHGMIPGVNITISGFTGSVSAGSVNGSQSVYTTPSDTTFTVNNPPNVTVTGKATVIRTTISIQAIYSHAGGSGGSNVVKDAKFSNITVYGYGQGDAFECNNVDNSAINGTFDGRELLLSNYPVLFTNCVSYEARNLPSESAAYDRCKFIISGIDYLGNSQPNPSVSTPWIGVPIGFSNNTSYLYNSCYFYISLPAGGAFPTLMGTVDSGGSKTWSFNFINCTCVLNVLRDYIVLCSATNNGTIKSYGSVWCNNSTTAGVNDFVQFSSGSGTASNVSFAGNWYYSAGSTLRYYNIAAYTGQTFANQAWTADTGSYKWNILPSFVSTSDPQPVASNALATTLVSQSQHSLYGINNVVYAGNYGSWQSPLTNISTISTSGINMATIYNSLDNYNGSKDMYVTYTYDTSLTLSKETITMFGIPFSLFKDSSGNKYLGVFEITYNINSNYNISSYTSTKGLYYNGQLLSMISSPTYGDSIPVMMNSGTTTNVSSNYKLWGNILSFNSSGCMIVKSVQIIPIEWKRFYFGGTPCLATRDYLGNWYLVVYKR